MELPQVEIASHSYAEARQVLSNCWIYTPERGLRAVTMHGNGSTLAVDGQRLQRWCILENDAAVHIVAYVYSAEEPGAELRDRILTVAHERFARYAPQ